MELVWFGYPPVEWGNKGWETCRPWKDDSNGCVDAGFAFI
jgi:hypothetical protein